MTSSLLVFQLKSFCSLWSLFVLHAPYIVSFI
jgi:hypothetical protein